MIKKYYKKEIEKNNKKEKINRYTNLYLFELWTSL